MAPAHWTTSTWVKIVCILVSIILFGAGMMGGQSLLGAKVQTNKEGVTANATEIKHIQETVDDKLERIETIQKTQDEKLDGISEAVITIRTIIEQEH